MKKSVFSLFILSVLALSTIFGTLALSPAVSADSSGPDYFATIYALNVSENIFDQEVWVTIVNSGITKNVRITNFPFETKDPLGSVAIAPNGNIFAVYDIYTGGYAFDIRYAVLNPYGSFIKTDTLLAANGSAPCVAVTPDGVVFAVWYDWTEDPDEIKGAMMNMGGDVLLIDSLDRPSNAQNPTVATSILDTSNNNVVIAWEEETANPSDGIQREIWFMVVDSGGNPVKVPTQVTYTEADSKDVNAAIMGNGNFALAWTEYNYSSGERWIYYAVFDGNGNVIKAPTNLTNTGESREPAVAAMLGSAIIVWEEGNIDPQDVYYATIDGQGNIASSPDPVTTYAGDDDDTDVAVDQKGNLVVVWEHTVFENGDQIDRGAYAILDPSGNIIITDVLFTDIDTSYIGGQGRRFVAAALPPTGPVGGTLLPIADLAIIAPPLLLALIALTLGAAVLIVRRRPH